MRNYQKKAMNKIQKYLNSKCVYIVYWYDTDTKKPYIVKGTECSICKRKSNYLIGKESFINMGRILCSECYLNLKRKDKQNE